MQKIRMAYLPNQRCGPHFSFVDPFVTVDHYTEAAQLLTEALKDVEAFTVTFENFSQFVFKSSAMFFAEPTIEPAGALHELLDAITKVFPHCTDQIDKAADKKCVQFHNFSFLRLSLPPFTKLSLLHYLLHWSFF